MSTRLRQLIESLETDLLKLEDNSISVQVWQQILAELAFYEGSIDGYFGPKTQEATRQLQKNFVLKPTGIFDADTWYALIFWAGEDYATSPKASRQTSYPKRRHLRSS